MEAATMMKIAAEAAAKAKEKIQNDDSGTFLSAVIGGIAAIIILPMAFLCCVIPNMSLLSSAAGNDGGVDYFRANYSISDENGGTFTYTSTSREESKQINDIRNLFTENLESDTGGTVLAAGTYSGNVPLFLQWDSRWGNVSYGNSTIGKGGCGPTSLAMIINSFGGNVTPVDIANFSVKNGYRVDGIGTSWGLFTTGAKAFGLTGAQISVSLHSIKTVLQSGKPIISSMTPGHFTKGGHFIVIAACNDDGTQVYIRDPNSEEKSKWWNTSIVIKESAAMWAFEKSA